MLPLKEVELMAAKTSVSLPAGCTQHSPNTGIVLCVHIQATLPSTSGCACFFVGLSSVVGVMSPLLSGRLLSLTVH